MDDNLNPVLSPVLAGAVEEPRESVRPGKWDGPDQRGGQVSTWCVHACTRPTDGLP